MKFAATDVGKTDQSTWIAIRFQLRQQKAECTNQVMS